MVEFFKIPDTSGRADSGTIRVEGSHISISTGGMIGFPVVLVTKYSPELKLVTGLYDDSDDPFAEILLVFKSEDEARDVYEYLRMWYNK